MKGICHICKKYRRVRVDYETGEKTCPQCQKVEQTKNAPKMICAGCGKFRSVVWCGEDGNGPYCTTCYGRIIWYPKHRFCLLCGNNVATMFRIRKGVVCGACFREECQENRCFICGRDQETHLRTKMGKSMCGACYMALLRALKMLRYK